MDFKNKLNQIRTLLGMQVELAQAKLADGTVIEAEQFEPEFSVGVVTENEIVPLPVGEYEMEDGRILVIAQEGVIAEIKEAITEQPEEVAEVQAEDVEEVQAKKIVESVSKETFFEAIEKLTKENEELKAEILALKSQKVEEVEKVELSAEPEAIVHNPENKKPEVISFVKTKNLKSQIYNNLFN